MGITCSFLKKTKKYRIYNKEEKRKVHNRFDDDLTDAVNLVKTME